MEKKLTYIDFVCHLCYQTFERRRNLHRHYTNIEKIPLSEVPRGNPHYSTPKDLQVTDDQNEAKKTMFYCPCCSEMLDSLIELGKHIKNKHVKNLDSGEYTDNHNIGNEIDSDCSILSTIDPNIKFNLPSTQIDQKKDG
ncbi:unnamed protein product [Rhizopus stolonifer]